MAGRLFTFGCSFTCYAWPTWADILIANHDGLGLNYGQPGAGNLFIHNRIVQAHVEHQFTAEDTVAVVWTSTEREDRFVNGAWLTHGTVYSQTMVDLLGEKFVREFCPVEHYLRRDLGLIASTMHMLDHIGCKTIYGAMQPLGEHEWDKGSSTDALMDLYRPYLDRIAPDYRNTIFGGSWFSHPRPRKDGYEDAHPSPMEHKRYIETFLCPGLALNDAYIGLLAEFEEKLWRLGVWVRPDGLCFPDNTRWSPDGFVPHIF